MRILLTEKDVIKAISNFYKVKEEYIKKVEEGYFDLHLPDDVQITIVSFKDIEDKLNGRSKVD